MNIKRTCSCSVGYIDQKTGELIPPHANNAKKPDKWIRVPVNKAIPQEMMDAQLGKSEGMKTKFDDKVMMNDLNNIIDKIC